MLFILLIRNTIKLTRDVRDGDDQTQQRSNSFTYALHTIGRCILPHQSFKRKKFKEIVKQREIESASN